MKKLAGNRLQFSRRLLGLLAGASLLVSGVNAGPKAGTERPEALKRGEVPQIATDTSSKRFLKNRIVADTESVAGKVVEDDSYDTYVDRLVDVLATFTPDQQRRIFHGQ